MSVILKSSLLLNISTSIFAKLICCETIKFSNSISLFLFTSNLVEQVLFIFIILSIGLSGPFLLSNFGIIFNFISYF